MTETDTQPEPSMSDYERGYRDGLRDGQERGEPEASWQWCYVEKWADGSGVYERVTFDAELRAFRYLADNAERVTALNEEHEPSDQIVPSIEKRRTYESAEWEPVEEAKS